MSMSVFQALKKSKEKSHFIRYPWIFWLLFFILFSLKFYYLFYTFEIVKPAQKLTQFMGTVGVLLIPFSITWILKPDLGCIMFSSLT